MNNDAIDQNSNEISQDASNVSNQPKSTRRPPKSARSPKHVWQPTAPTRKNRPVPARPKANNVPA